MKYFFYSVCCICFFTECRSISEKELYTRPLDLDAAVLREVPLSTLVSSLTFIPLETDSVLLSGSPKIVIGDSIILAYFTRGNYDPALFGSAGRYIGRPGRFGNGPGELPAGAPFYDARVFLNTAAETVDYNLHGCCYRFGFDGRFIRKHDVVENLKKQIADTSLLRSYAPGWVKLNNYGENMLAVYRGHVYVSTDGGHSFSTERGSAAYDMFYVNGNSTSYTMTNWNLFPDHAALFDYETASYKRFYYSGTVTVPYSFRNAGGFTGGKNSPTRMLFISETKKYLIFATQDQRTEEYEKKYFLYDKKADSLFRFAISDAENDPVLFVNDLCPRMSVNFDKATQDGRLYGLMQAADFRIAAAGCGDPELEKLAARMKDDDNQVVVLAEMKE